VKTLLATLLSLFVLMAASAQAPSPAAPASNEMEALKEAALQEAAARAQPTSTVPGGAGVPVIAPNAPAQPATESAPATGDVIIEKGSIKFPAAALDDVLTIYAELVGRTILRPSNLPATTITLTTQTDLTTSEAIMALDAVLALNQISMINVGDKFVKAVPMAQAGQEGAAISSAGAESLPDLGQYVSHVVQLKNVQASEVIPALQPFAKIPNSVLAIESSNILILRDFSENVKRMMEMLERIDVVVESNYSSEVIPIKYALAADIAGALNSLSTGGGGATVGGRATSRGGVGGSSRASRATPRGQAANPYAPQQQNTRGATQQPGASSSGSFTDRLRSIINKASVSGDLEILGQTRIIADERTNSLLIFASAQDMAMIKDIVSKLDVVLAQVLIEALVIEVGLGDSLDWGISYLQNPQGSDGAWKGAGGVFNNVNFFDPETIKNATNLIGGFSYYAKYQDDFLVAITAAAQDNNVSILSRPRVQTSHAVEANIFVGETRPYPTGTSYGGYGGNYSQIQQQRIGIELNVLPLINPDGLVVMDILQDIQSVGGEVMIDNVGLVPITQDRSANAKVAVKSGETIILGGFISAEKRSSNSGVPFLKDIPGLGLLFRAQSDSKSRKELMIFIKPTVLETPEIAARVAIEEKNKMPGVLGAEAALTKDYEEAMRKVSSEAGIDYKAYTEDLDAVE